MRRLLLVLAVLAAPTAQAHGQPLTISEAPTLGVTLEPAAARAGRWWVQGQLVLTVRVSARDPFEELDLDVPEIDGAETLVLVRPRTRIVRSYAGQGTVLETVIAIFPVRAGPLEIPPVRAAGMVAPEPEHEVRFDESSAPIVIDVAGIDPEYGDAWWLVSPRVEVAETWSTPLDQVRGGDVVRRTVDVTAFGVTAERIRLPEHGRTKRVDIALAAEERRTEKTADGVVGRVTRSWDLRIPQREVVYVSPFGIDFWNPLLGEARTASVPGHRLEPLPADADAIAGRLMAEAQETYSGSRLIAGVLLGLAALPLVSAIVAAAWAVLPSRADRRLSSLCAPAEAPEAVYRAVVAWSRESGCGLRPAGEAVGSLERRLFARAAAPVDPPRVAADLRRIARRERIARLRARLVSVARRLIG